MQSPESAQTTGRTRRAFLRIAGLFGLGVGAARVLPLVTEADSHEAGAGRWSDPQTWEGSAPGEADLVRISKSVVLDDNVTVGGLVVEAGGQLIWPRAKSRTLRSKGNVVVHGRLVMRPKSPKIKHALIFENVDESKFVGGGTDVIGSDVGLWVMHGGKLQLRGSSKTSWAYAASSVAAGSTTIELDRDPHGWHKGDEIVIAPTVGANSADHHAAFDVSTISAISGRSLNLAQPTSFAHPSADVNGTLHTAEVLNLTRNVRIEGASKERSHVFIHSRAVQTIRNVAIRHMGPQQDGAPVQGRYGIHFHMSGNGSRGSVVKGVVVRNCGSHSFVPHLSNGIKFRECIAYDVHHDAFWWDPIDSLTHDIVWDSCVAALVRVDQGQKGFYTVTGFNLQDGDRNVCKRCVAVGIGLPGAKTSSGFLWPSKGPTTGVWGFEDCVAHNNVANGIFAWQNDNKNHVIRTFHAYNNGKAGIEHGAYKNRYLYEDTALYGNGDAALYLHANSSLPKNRHPLVFRDMVLDGGGVSPASVFISKHAIESDTAVEIRDCVLRGYKETPVRIDDQGRKPGLQDFIRCTVQPGDRDLEPGDFDLVSMAAGGRIRVQRRDGSALKIDSTGAVEEIPPFA